jgi:hypothetical protein
MHESQVFPSNPPIPIDELGELMKAGCRFAGDLIERYGRRKLDDILRAIGPCVKSARSEADNAMRDESGRRFPGMNERGDTKRNAVNHCTSACWASIRCGRDAADFYLNKTYESFDRAIGKRGDKHNNLAGFDCAADILKRKADASAGSLMPFSIVVLPIECFACCMSKLDKGHLMYV